MPGTEWNLLRGHDINDAGQIIVSAANTITGGIRNLLLTPLTQLPAGTHVQDITITFQPARRGDVTAVARVRIVDHNASQ